MKLTAPKRASALAPLPWRKWASMARSRICSTALTARGSRSRYQRKRFRQDPLANGPRRQDVIHQMRRGLRHPPGIAIRTQPDPCRRRRPGSRGRSPDIWPGRSRRQGGRIPDNAEIPVPHRPARAARPCHPPLQARGCSNMYWGEPVHDAARADAERLAAARNQRDQVSNPLVLRQDRPSAANTVARIDAPLIIGASRSRFPGSPAPSSTPNNLSASRRPRKRCGRSPTGRGPTPALDG